MRARGRIETVSQYSLEAERVTLPEPGKVVTQSRVVTSHLTERKTMRW